MYLSRYLSHSTACTRHLSTQSTAHSSSSEGGRRRIGPGRAARSQHSNARDGRRALHHPTTRRLQVDIGARLAVVLGNDLLFRHHSDLELDRGRVRRHRVGHLHIVSYFVRQSADGQMGETERRTCMPCRGLADWTGSMFPVESQWGPDAPSSEKRDTTRNLREASLRGRRCRSLHGWPAEKTEARSRYQESVPVD